MTDDVADAGIVELGLRLAGRGLSTVDLGRALLARAEGTLLRVAHALQLATDWHRRRPPLAP